MHNGNGRQPLMEIPETPPSSGVPAQLPAMPAVEGGTTPSYDWDWQTVSPPPIPEPEDVNL